MVNRKDDLIDIWSKDPSDGTAGWQAPPTEPIFIIEDDDHTLDGYLDEPPTNGIILIQDKKFERERHSATYENRVQNINCAIIMVDEDGLEDIFDQAREVFDRYNDAPWSTSALGTSTTYSYVAIDAGEEDVNVPLSKNAMNIICQLAEIVEKRG